MQKIAGRTCFPEAGVAEIRSMNVEWRLLTETMELTQAIQSRRSTRRYKDQLVPRPVVERLIALSTHAPTACNRRAWRFILIEQQHDLCWLYEQGAASFLKETKQALLVCYSSRNDNREWHDGEQSAAAAICYFQLLAHAEGIGSCWICHLPPKREVSRYFKIPSSFSPVALISFGYYDPVNPVVERVALTETILCDSRWDFPSPAIPVRDKAALVIRRLARGIYYLLPGRKFFRNYATRYEKKFPDSR